MDVPNLQELYQNLVEILQNELEVSELLPCEAEIVDYMIEQINHMTNIITLTKKKWSPFCVEQHQIELERITYLVNNYLRTRLKKIEASAPYFIKMLRTDIDRALKYLSPVEAKYLDRYNDSIDSYMMDVVLKDMPENLRRFRLASMIAEHEEQAKTNYAFVMGKTEATILDGDVEIQLEPDICRILSVSSIIEQLEKKSDLFQLI